MTLIHGGREHVLRPGSLIGRLSTATLRVQDARVSEAHAMIVLRGRTLRMLALRGTLRLDDAVVDDIALMYDPAAPQRIELAPDVIIEVGTITVPSTVLALQIDAGEPFEPCAPVHALISGYGGVPEWVPMYRVDALAHVYVNDREWVLQQGSEIVRLNRPMSVAVGRHVLHAVWAHADGTVQTSGPGAFDGRAPEALHVSVRGDTATVIPGHREQCHLNGKMARIIAELAELRSPVGWDVVAGELWPEVDVDRRRKSFDRELGRLRIRLREHGIRDDLVRSNGKGLFELYLRPGDRVVDDLGEVLWP